VTDPTFAVQFAVMAILRAGVPAIGQRVHDFVPQSATFPYITISVPSAVPIDETCWDRTEITFQIDVWSNTVPSVEAKEIAAVVRDFLHETDIAVAGFEVDRARVQGAFFTRENDTQLHRARLMVSIEAQPA
jgi:hypothetical protein